MKRWFSDNNSSFGAILSLGFGISQIVRFQRGDSAGTRGTPPTTFRGA